MNVSSVNTFKNKIDTYLIRAGYTSVNNCCTLDKPMASLSTCLVIVKQEEKWNLRKLRESSWHVTYLSDVHLDKC